MKLCEKVAIVLERQYPKLPRPQRIHALANRMKLYDIDVTRILNGGRNTEKMYRIIKMLEPIAAEVDVDLLSELNNNVYPGEIDQHVQQAVDKETRRIAKRGAPR